VTPRGSIYARSWVHASSNLRVTITSKVVDVLLLLGIKQNLLFKNIFIVYITHFA
jgi:hypothetical protein